MEKSILELFWKYDPNGLVIVDKDMKIVESNPSFEHMFQIKHENARGFYIERLLGRAGIDIFKKVFESGESVTKDKIVFPSYGVTVRFIAFKIPGKDLAAGILVDITSEEKKKKELAEIKLGTINKINDVILKQMEVAQEIASLLGETVAETKASLLNLLKIIQGGKE
ncbi:PAS domain-containing protein [Thermotoga sp. KOL6]|uniref:PAS domain-containing protein n=1 Tax=Thermotoga sp. KOL6 TaxID=126741 RepID=UPI000C780CB1|nr:PAS domain-containing protein [Thermotoga sp. KOL6]PLV60051.1 hypothetical protein AS005_01815 [Thermotoga sp. KOL6]